MPRILVSAVIILLLVPVKYAMSATNLASNAIAEGKKIAFDPNKGNCLACHAIKGGKLPGNIGPPLVKMKQRYPNKAYLREQIGNPINNNPNSIMPLYEKYKILSESELNKVVEFIYSL